MSARQALTATPTLDVAQWIRTNTRGAGTDPGDWDGAALVWWAWKSDNVNVTVGNRPPEWQAWDAILAGWRTSIDDALVRVSDAARNASVVPITRQDGTKTTMPAGTNLIFQRGMIDKVRPVLTQ